MNSRRLSDRLLVVFVYALSAAGVAHAAVLIDDEFDDGDVSVNQLGVGPGWHHFGVDEFGGQLIVAGERPVIDNGNALRDTIRELRPHIERVEWTITLDGFAALELQGNVNPTEFEDFDLGFRVDSVFELILADSGVAGSLLIIAQLAHGESRGENRYGIRVGQGGGCDRCTPPPPDFFWVADLPEWDGSSPIDLVLDVDRQDTTFDVVGTETATLAGSPTRPTLVLPDRLIATTVGFGNITPLAFVDRIQMAVVVPEPSTLLLIALGGSVLSCSCVRRGEHRSHKRHPVSPSHAP